MSNITTGASRSSSFISLIKTIVGAGLLSMPYAFSTDGIVVGLFIIVLAAITAGYGLFLQAYVSRYVPRGAANFFNVCSITYPSLSVLFDLAIAIQCFGCAISYLVLIGDLMPTIFNSVPLVSEEHVRSFWILMSAFACVPLSFLKNLDSLKYTSILGLAAIGYLCVLVILEYFFGKVPSELKGDIKLVPASVKDVFSTFSIIVFAFTGHQNMFSIVNEAENASLVSLTALINSAIVCSSTLFILVGLCGYLTFGSLVGGNVVLSYPASWWTTIGRLAIVLMVVFSFPLMIHPARISVNNIYYWLSSHFHSVKTTSYGPNDYEESPLIESSGETSPNDPKKHIVPLPHRTFCTLTILLLVVGYTAAITLKSFAFVLAIVGATGSTSISFILPGLFGFKLVGSEKEHISTTEKLLKWAALLLAMWGVSVMIVCLYSSLAL